MEGKITIETADLFNAHRLRHAISLEVVAKPSFLGSPFWKIVWKQVFEIYVGSCNRDVKQRPETRFCEKLKNFPYRLSSITICFTKVWTATELQNMTGKTSMWQDDNIE